MARIQAGGHTGPVQVGAQIGPWTVLGELGRGGFGAVLRAAAPGHPEVALKLLLDPLDLESRRRFEREVQLLRSVSHPALVRVFDHGVSQQGLPWLALELLPGGSLARRVAQNGPLDLDDALALGRDLCGALEALHEVGVVHRDLKPENVLFDAGGAPRLTDLGLGRSFRPGASRLTASGMTLGTPAYMPPEQVDGRDVGPAADVWALGATLYFALTGRAPFAGPSALVVLENVLRSAPPLPSSLRPDLPRALEALLLRCLNKDPAGRPDLPGLRAALARPAGAPAGRRSLGLALAGGAVAVGMTTGALLALRGRAAPDGGSPAPERPAVDAPPLALADVPEVARLLQEADQLAQREEDARALALANEAVLRAPLLAEAYSLRGNLRSRTGDLEGAEADLDRALALNPSLAGAWWIRGFVRYKRDDNARARADLDRAIALDPQRPTPYYLRAYVRRAEGDRSGAMQDLDLVAERDFPDRGQALLLRGTLLREAGDLSRARQDHDRAVGLAPTEFQAWRERAITRAEQGDLLGGLQDLEQARTQAPSDEQGALDQLRERVTQRLLQAELPAAPPAARARALCARAEARTLGGDARGARADVEEALRLDPDLAPARVVRARLRWSIDHDPLGALEDLERAIALGDLEALIDRAALRMDRGDPRAALSDLDLALQRGPRQWRAALLRGAAKGLLGDAAGARADLDRALSLAPGRPEVLRTRAETFAQRREYPAALAELERLLARAPADPPGLVLRSRIRILHGELAGAREDVERVLAANPRQPDALCTRAHLRMREGDLEGARADFTRALELDPTARWRTRPGAAWRSWPRRGARRPRAARPSS